MDCIFHDDDDAGGKNISNGGLTNISNKGNGGVINLNNNKINGALQLGSNRRALGDIGNLVGALSARCIVSKDGLMQNNQE